jgi:hypothetical protein
MHTGSLDKSPLCNVARFAKQGSRQGSLTLESTLANPAVAFGSERWKTGCRTVAIKPEGGP